VVVARTAATIELSDDEEQQLRAVLRAPSASQQEALRVRIVLRAAAGASNTQIAAEVGVSLPTVGLWRRNFSERGLDGLQTAPWPGRPRKIDDADVARVLEMMLEDPAGSLDALERAAARGHGGDLGLDRGSDLA
jgi:transposase